MRIKIDENLRIIANRANRPEEIISIVLATMLENLNLVEGIEENYGEAIKDCAGVDEKEVIAFVEVLHAIGIDNVNDTTFEALCNCIVIGYGDCPDCGGELELIDEKYRTKHINDPYLEPERIVEYQRWRCPICGREVEK